LVSADCGLFGTRTANPEKPSYSILSVVSRSQAIQGTALTGAAIQGIVDAAEPFTAYDAAYGGTTGRHDKIAMHAHGEIEVLARPMSAGPWAVEHLRVEISSRRLNRYPVELPDEHAALLKPDFVAAGPQIADWIEGYRGNARTVIASGSKMIMIQIATYYDELVNKNFGWISSVGVDLKHLVSPTRRTHRIFLPAQHGPLVHFVPWEGEQPYRGEPAYTVYFGARRGASPIIRVEKRPLAPADLDPSTPRR